MLSLYSGFINNLEAENHLTCCITVVCSVEKFYYFSCMDYIPTFEKGKRFNDDYYDFIKALGIELEKEGYFKILNTTCLHYWGFTKTLRWN